MILLSILNSLAPTAAIALIAWGAMRLLRANAATRYGVWWTVLVSVVAMVLWPQRSPIASAAAPVQLPPATTPADDSAATLIALAFAVWVTFALYRTARLITGYVWLRRIQREARPWTHPGVVLSDDVAGPITAGFVHPVVVLPASFPKTLTAAEMQHVLLHEDAHIARRDQWANLLAKVVGVFFGLHPVAAFAFDRIERERERACDDWVVAATGEAKPYAASLTRIFELTRRGSQPDLASGFMGSRLGGRIEELLTNGRQFTRRASFAILAVIVVPIAMLSLRAPATVAFAQEPQPARPVIQAAPATPVAQAKPAIPVTQAPGRDAVADRLEALLARLEAVLDRMNPQGVAGEAATLREFMVEKNAAAQLQAAQDELRVRQAAIMAQETQMRAQEAQMKGQQRELERQLMEVKRSINFYDLEKLIAKEREKEKAKEKQ